MQAGGASRDVCRRFPFGVDHVVNFDVILFLQPLPKLPYVALDKIRSACAGQ